MSLPSGLCLLACLVLCLGCVGCAGTPGPEVPRPDQVMDFPTLYRENCAACHGANGKNGAAISLSNPVYLAFSGEAQVRQITAKGVAGKLMPAFARSSGGSLTDGQIASLVHGLFAAWAHPEILAGSPAPPYQSVEAANANTAGNDGQKMFDVYCGRCHRSGSGSILDPAYLALVSNQSLRSVIVAGRPDLGMPDWRSEISGGGAITSREITAIVDWLASQRTIYPGQPYAARQ